MFVKICGITNEDDALLSVAMGADAVGFIFAPSTRQVSAQLVFDITRRLPPEILTVGVFRDEHPSRVIDIVNRSGVKAAQLHGNESPAQTAEVAASIRWVIKAFAAGSSTLTQADRYGTPMVLVDAPSPGSGKVFDWDLAAEAPDGLQIILAGGLTPDNVAAGIEAVEPWGVDVSSGVERAPGRKDAMKVKRFIEHARAAAPTPYLGPDELPYDWADE
ncbi:MAG: phosphoribosylanthranilate isomerase [Ilumatobacter sp.]|nr:MAG: phosphoribosylanthranilate isomerase [Ilumatobacter sp.]